MNRRDSILATHPAVIAVWAALIAVVTLVPAFPMIGTGATFSVSAALVPLAGILFGPIPGAICAAIGAFIGQLIAPHTVFFGPLSFLIPTLNALCAGFAMRRRWYVPLAVIVVLSLVWFVFPLGRSVWFTPLIWTLGIGASLVGWFAGSNWLSSDNRAKLFAGVFLAAMCGTIVDHSFGSLWALIMFKLPREIWLAVLPLAPVERTLFSLGSAIVGTPLMIGLPQIGVMVGPKMHEEELFDEEIV
ncbi:MAG: ECF transporter S component [Anaerolineae bacterium]|jgi:uncharacterized membrane protein